MSDFGLIRTATLSDLPHVVDLEKRCFDEKIAYNPNQLKYLITRANSNCLIEENEEILRGFIVVLYKRGTGVAGIETLSVDPYHRGKGIAKRLLNFAEEDVSNRGIKKLRLEVSMGNISALNLYYKSGFRVKSILKNYYINEHYGTHDAYRMVKDLTT